MIKQASIEDSRTVAELAMLVWPDNEIDVLEEEMKDYIISDKGVNFIYFDKTIPVAFAQCGLRKDYVEGTESSPVGYLGGIYVKPEYRMTGIARNLLIQCENWVKSHGCSEFASDCELNNIDSLKFHLQVGFEEANRIVCFTKKL